MIPTVPERSNDWLDKPFDFHILILELLLPKLCLKYFSPVDIYRAVWAILNLSL